MEIIDNFIPEKEFTELQEQVLSKFFPWFYLENITGNINPNYTDSSGFYHSVYNKITGTESRTVEIFTPLFKALETIGYTSDSLSVLRLGLLIPSVTKKAGDYMIPHIDIQDKHYDTALLYIDDSDGDTVFFNEFYDGTTIDNYTVKERVSPKKNRLVLFDGFQYHAATCPVKSQRRIVLNINLLPRK